MPSEKETWRKRLHPVETGRPSSEQDASQVIEVMRHLAKDVAGKLAGAVPGYEFWAVSFKMDDKGNTSFAIEGRNPQNVTAVEAGVNDKALIQVIRQCEAELGVDIGIGTLPGGLKLEI